MMDEYDAITFRGTKILSDEIARLKAREKKARELLRFIIKDQHFPALCSSHIRDAIAYLAEQEPKTGGKCDQLEKIRVAIESTLGDTDPNYPEDMTDDDIRHEDPIFWAHVEIIKLQARLSTGKVEEKPTEADDEAMEKALERLLPRKIGGTDYRDSERAGFKKGWQAHARGEKS